MTSFHFCHFVVDISHPSVQEVFAQDGLITEHVCRCSGNQIWSGLPRTVSKNYKPEPVYNFRHTRCVLRFTEHSTNFPSFPKFAVSPESLGTGQAALGAARWFPCSAFLEVTSAGPSSGLHPSARGPPACARGFNRSLSPDGPAAQRTRRKAFPFPTRRLASPKNAPTVSRGPEMRTTRAPARSPQAPPPAPGAGTRAAPASSRTVRLGAGRGEVTEGDEGAQGGREPLLT